MFTLDLNGIWKMKRIGKDNWIDAKVPGSVFNDLLNAGIMDDPFYRDNELLVREFAIDDYKYYYEFNISEEMLNEEKVVLHCDGLDTLTEIKINGVFVANTENMHRIYEFNIKNLLCIGKNSISIVFYSPVKYIEKKDAEYHLFGEDGGNTIPGMPYIRKAHYMLGWDWGPQIPDSGIWRGISIKGYKHRKIEDIYITQKHSKEMVSLDIRVRTEIWDKQPILIEARVMTPDNKIILASATSVAKEHHIFIDIETPNLWWPNGFGNQPLYNVEVKISQNKLVLDSKSLNIGLRTIGIKRENDKWGESFEFEVNGVSIFAMGANYIPEDNILARCNAEKTEKLIKQCIAANFNCIRVWGGGLYPEDYFFDFCDKYGLIVWQDFMFACAVYEMTDEFAENIRKEAEDNVKRIRHHASLGIWCGNNEMELAWESWDLPKVPRLKTDYIKQFEILLPLIIKENDPNTFYWPASPSSGGGFDNPNDENRGDVHYWSVWHELKPFTDYEKYYFRFVSEFGFQSFPCLKTVNSFTLPEDHNIFSYIMEKHQKNGSANGKILFYLSDNFKNPKDFDSLLYTSQILQGEAIRYGVEHWRRNRGRCMGAIYWQLNDCWPVASWSSIDSFGRWKALHYFAKRFFAPVLLTAKQQGAKVELNLANETLASVKRTVLWKLMSNDLIVLAEGKECVVVDSLSSQTFLYQDYNDILKSEKDMMKTFMVYYLDEDVDDIQGGIVLFTKPKHFEFLKPEIVTEITESKDHINISLVSKTLSKYVEITLEGMDCVFSDNYFDIWPENKKLIHISKEELSKDITIEEIRNKLKIRSVYDIA
ncbi:MAG: csxA [Neobacillus sp.]|nr:csxA [Neobacillus sp.]